MLLDSKRRAEYFNELAQKYGDIYTIRLGFSYIFVLNSLEAVKEAHVHLGDAFAGRGLPLLRKLFTKGKGMMQYINFDSSE